MSSSGGPEDLLKHMRQDSRENIVVMRGTHHHSFHTDDIMASSGRREEMLATMHTSMHTTFARQVTDQPPVVRRNKKRNKTTAERTKRCASVIIEPARGFSITPHNQNKRQSMYELGVDGWMLDAVNEDGTAKKELNIDEEINTMLALDTSVDVTLGRIKLTF